MPEYFFHVRLDTGARNSTSSNRLRKTDIFATPPVLAPPSGQVAPTPSGNYTAADSNDWRAGRIVIESIDMVHPDPVTNETGYVAAPGAADPSSPSIANTSSATPATSLRKRMSTNPGNAATKARFEPSDVGESEAGWGVVRVFRDTEETPGLYDIDTAISNDRRRNADAATISVSSSLPRLPVSTSHHGSSSAHNTSTTRHASPAVPFKDEDCTTLAILAVPSYMSPADLMGWVGEKTRYEVSHFRLIKTERANRYMVLMRFRSGRRAREWRKDWNGASFDAAEPETAHVVFVKSIEFSTEKDDGEEMRNTFPDVEDPFTSKAVVGARAMTVNAKPLAPPTPNLVEMPTCPVCLERMDESTGLLTIQCQHVFHCTCLHKWRGSGCPVCRFTHDGLSGRRGLTQADDQASGPNECSICRSESNLWICLICGNIGCGRYDAAHAFLHWQHSEHTFSMDMTTQRIWDYASDGYVHRIVQNKLDGKIAEKAEPSEETAGDGHDADFAEYIPREKSDAIGREYTALLTSQLESQRAYFEEKIGLTADKASQASLAATQATEAASRALDQLARLEEEHHTLTTQTIPALERDRDRAFRRADKAQEMARKFEKDWREEKAVNEGLMERLKRLDVEVPELKTENADLKEMNRDLQFFISAQQRLKDMDVGEDVVDGSVSLPEEKKKNKGRGRRGKTRSEKEQRQEAMTKGKEKEEQKGEGQEEEQPNTET